MTDLITLAALAARFGRSEKTLRRYLPAVPGLAPIRLGRSMLFSQQDVTRIEAALRCPLPFVSAGKRTTRAAPSASGRKASPSPSSPQARLDELLRNQLSRPMKPKSARKSLTVLPGGQSA